VTVTVDAEDLTRSVVVTVTDTGLGIPPEDLDRVFDKFYRIKRYERNARGTGLGLNLCRNIVEQVHHGRIGVDSRLGEGARFWFSVPASHPASMAA
jgi:two-component system phosphate regulon sensor histidine kinase PhoR